MRHKSSVDFLGDNFLLPNETARRLYFDYAAEMPIFDFHCHLPQSSIADNSRFASITEVWLGGDHYKWRAMRANGIPEESITGGASDWDKFYAWAATVEKLPGNPLYHWTHLELRRYFGIDEVLSRETAEDIFRRCGEKISEKSFSVWAILESMNVKALCTTDDPGDSLAVHERISSLDLPAAVTPAMRPDRGHLLEDPEKWNDWVDRLADETDPGAKETLDYRGFLRLLEKRHEQFHRLGCRLSDHAVTAPPSADYNEEEISGIFSRTREGRVPSEKEILQFRTAFLVECAGLNEKLGWTMQIHMGALRNINTGMFKALGPDTGYDAMGDFPIARGLASFLDRVERETGLPKMILYPLNPSDNPVIATIIGAFQGAPVPGKIQLGSAWWFNDHIDGMREQMRILGNIGLLSRFVGMVTDSRSFLSYPRHEYFRRILCGILGEWVERGELPADTRLLGEMVQDISFRNAAGYFALPGVDSK